jgi:hypothetical protein
MEEDDVHEWIWETVFIPGEEIDETVTVAKQQGRRCSVSPAIPRRKTSLRQQDLLDVGRCALKKRGGRNLVRELREIKGKEVVQREIKRGSRLTRNRRCPLAVTAARRPLAWAAWRRFS